MNQKRRQVREEMIITKIHYFIYLLNICVGTECLINELVYSLPLRNLSSIREDIY